MDMMPARKMTIVPPVLHRLTTIITSVGMTVFFVPDPARRRDAHGLEHGVNQAVLLVEQPDPQTMQEATAGMMDGR